MIGIKDQGLPDNVLQKLLLKCLEQKHIMTALLMESGQ